jgi:ribosomal protein L22
MSAEQDTPEEAKAAKPAAAKAASKADKPATEKKAATKKAPAEKAAAADGESKAAKKPTAKKPTAKKAAANKAAAKKAAKAPASESAKESASEAKPARKQAKAAPPRRRVVRAHARYVRTSARKARMVCGHIRGKSVQEARAILAFTPREVARDWAKLLESAVANAESNHELLEDDLVIREAYADEGPTIKRFRPRAMGRATPIRKRTSHLTITLTPAPEPGTNKRHG